MVQWVGMSSLKPSRLVYKVGALFSVGKALNVKLVEPSAVQKLGYRDYFYLYQYIPYVVI